MIGKNFLSIIWDEAGDKINTFNIPNLIGQFIRGASNTRKVGSLENDTTALPRMRQFKGTAISTSGGYNNSPSGNTNSYVSNPCFDPSSTHSHTVIITDGGDPETRPKNYGVNYIIKIK